MEIRQLRSFCIAVRLQSISRAAEALGIGQPTVTSHIQKLERELGADLFDRQSRPIRVSAAGRALHELATPLVDGIDNLASTTVQVENQRPVLIGATFDIIPHMLFETVRLIKYMAPDLKISVRSGHRRDVVTMVREREVDVGILPGKEIASDLQYTLLAKYDRVLIAPLNHPILESPVESLANIAQYPLVMLEPRSYTRTLLDTEFRRQGLEPNIVMELDSMDYIKRYVMMGMGVSIGPRLAIEPEDLTRIGVIRLDDILESDEVGFLTATGRPRHSNTRQFIDILRKTLIPLRACRTCNGGSRHVNCI